MDQEQKSEERTQARQPVGRKPLGRQPSLCNVTDEEIEIAIKKVLEGWGD